MKTEITKELLISDGWVEVKDAPGIYLEKLIENRNPINTTPEDTDIKIILHSMFNVQQFAVFFPDGGMLNFGAYNMEQLNDFINRIDFYDCPY